MSRFMSKALGRFFVLMFVLCVNFLHLVWAHTGDKVTNRDQPDKASAGSYLTLERAVKNAIDTDPWIEGSNSLELALLAEAVAAGELPDPSLSLGLANVAVDTLDFDQEPMSQLKMGIAQNFPRGDTRKLRRRQREEEGAVQPLLRENRKAELVLTVSLLWLDSFMVEQSIALIERNYFLFEQLVDISHANYIATSGPSRQQDVIRAELELSRLKERLIDLRRRSAVANSALMEWLEPHLLEQVLPSALPELSIDGAPNSQGTGDFMQNGRGLKSSWASRVQRHPRLQAMDQQLRLSSTDIELAEQQYKSEWAVNASYAYRDDDPFGQDRSDFVSVGITVDLPLFTKNRQDQQVKAAHHRRAALQAERDLLFRQLFATFEKAWVDLLGLDQREQFYRENLLPKMHDQADAALAAYTSDGGDFAEVMRARIAELNTDLMALELKVDRQKILAKLRYVLAGSLTASRQNFRTRGEDIGQPPVGKTGEKRT